MRIRETLTLEHDVTTFDQAAVLEAIRELELQRERDEIAASAYFQKKRSLIRML
ncbi:MAG: hypothetical protein QM606_00095 [Leucobacter sp.]